MGYSKSIRTLQAIAPKLAMLAAGKPTTWRVQGAGQADLFAYKVREALWIAANHHQQFSPSLARAYHNFKIVVDGEFVRAKLGASVAVEQPSPIAPGFQHAMDQFVNYPELPIESRGMNSSQTCVGPQDLAAVIQFWIDSQPSNAEISVVEANLSNEELNQLFTWARNLQPPWEVLHTAGETHLLIRPARGRKLIADQNPQVSTAIPGDVMPKDEVIG